MGHRTTQKLNYWWYLDNILILQQFNSTKISEFPFKNIHNVGKPTETNHKITRKIELNPSKNVVFPCLYAYPLAKSMKMARKPQYRGK